MRNHLLIIGLALAFLLGSPFGVARAIVITSYDAGVAPSAGTGGAAAPATQGWAQTGGATGFSHGAAANGGWRITDGTAGQPWFYQQNLSATDVTHLNTYGWTATWTTAVNADAVQDTGVPNGVDDYYSSVPTRQNDNAMWIEVNGSYRYILTHEVAADGDIVISDGTTDFDITSTNDLTNLSHELGTGSPSAFYITYALTYDPDAGTASLTDSLGGSHGIVVTSGAATQDRVVWGATSSNGQGSTTWNQVSLEVIIPEPSSMGLLAAGMLGFACCWRRRRV